MKKYTKYIPIVIAVLLLAGFILSLRYEISQSPTGGFMLSPTHTEETVTGPTHSIVTIGMTKTGSAVASSTEIFGTGWTWARCENINQNGYPVSLMLNSTATTSAVSGIVIVPMASSTSSYFYEFGISNPYRGNKVYGYSQSTSTLSCIYE
jgi:hypothetical protein